MQTLRKKTSPLKFFSDKNETSRFLGEGVSFKAKLIGILEVSEARGDRMCQEALADLKMAIRAAGEHKQRITINIAIDGLRLRDEKTGDSLYHHPVHKISFIAQDMSDSRAFGYIFGSPDTGHRFFGIKTDKAASQVVIAMRDLFQVVFALKKKEIELAKQHLDKARYSTSPLFAERTKLTTVAKMASTESKSAASTTLTTPAVADLVDLELELSSLQQGLTQMERITPSDPFGRCEDPFGDSFTSFSKPILPPPPSSGRDRNARLSETSSVFSPKTTDLLQSNRETPKDFSFNELNNSQEEPTSSDWFTPPAGNSSLFEDTLLSSSEKERQHEQTKQEILSQFDVFTDLDPLGTKKTTLGTGKIKPYVDKKHFFQELKNPPKKVLNELALSTSSSNNVMMNSIYNSDPFGEDPFDQTDPFAEAAFKVFENDVSDYKLFTAAKVSDAGNDLTQLFKSELDLNASTRKLFDSHSFDVSSESEAPDPPPRPANTLIKPPPLPPKKQSSIVDLASKPPPPPRPPPEDQLIAKHVHDDSPPIPMPSRKIVSCESRFETNFEEETYLTPIGLLPPPKSNRRSRGGSPSLPPLTDLSLDTLDITLSQLTLSGLNELAAKLNIPASQLSNMTLVQLTSYLSNFIKNKNSDRKDADVEVVEQRSAQNFADFNQFNTQQQPPIMTAPTYDRYAAFRELLQEDKPEEEDEEEAEEEETSKKTEDVDPEEEANEAAAEIVIDTSDNVEFSPITDSSPKPQEDTFVEDVAHAHIQLQMDRYAALREIAIPNEGDRRSMEDIDTIEEDEEEEDEAETEEAAEEFAAPECIIDKTSSVENDLNATAILDEDVQNDNTTNAAQTGSLSDVLSGSSPEIEDNQETSKKTESWAIFEQPSQNLLVVDEATKDVKAAAHSEEGVSPWSSDSKEFGNGSPTDWQRRGERWRSGRSQEGWWDTSAEPETAFYHHRRSTDSFDDDYDVYDRPRRPRRQGQTWCNAPTGGHSSSSRDVSPWEDEPRRRDGRQSWTTSRHSRHAEQPRRRRTDSWDEEEDDDDGYEEERVHWRDWEERRMRAPRRRESDRERWCCPDYDAKDMSMAEPLNRYSSGRWSNPERRKIDERYYARESQESPWEDEYGNEIEPHYMSVRRMRARPSSATEIDRKTGEIKARGSVFAGGNDGERDRRYVKSTRRSKSRDSQYAEPPRLSRAIEAALRPSGRKVHSKFEDFDASPKEATSLATAKKLNTMGVRKGRSKESPKADDANTFPRKSRHIQTPVSQQSMFENDFVQFEDFDDATADNKWYKKPSAPKQTVGNSRFRQKSLFEDDFSPSEKTDRSATSGGSSKTTLRDQNGGRADEKAAENVGTNNIDTRMVNSRKRLARISQLDSNLKKSESVNIFARESDPFDDDFFVGENANGEMDKWAHQFDDNNKRKA